MAVDSTGRTLVAADYMGGSAASFSISDGKLSEAVWTEHYKDHGPNSDRQEAAHAHFVSFSPDNHYVYINDLGGDCIHIYRLDASTSMLTGTREPTPAPRAQVREPSTSIPTDILRIASTNSFLQLTFLSGAQEAEASAW